MKAAGATPQTGAEQYFAICLCVKDQQKDIREWIEHHARFGASKIYIFDDNSSTPMISEFSDLVESGLVEYHFLQTFEHASKRAQLYVYDRCIRDYAKRHRFIAFIDADEFIILRDTTAKDIPTFLKPYEPYGGFVMNWQGFASSGFVDRPPGGALESYFQCLPRLHGNNRHTKTIANPQHVIAARDPHHFSYKDGMFAVNERFERVDTPLSKAVTNDKIVLNHYVTKSEKEYEEKMARGSLGSHKEMNFFHTMNKQATENCTYAMQLG